MMQKSTEIENKFAQEFFTGFASHTKSHEHDEKQELKVELTINGAFEPSKIIISSMLLNKKYKLILENLILDSYNQAKVLCDIKVKSTEQEFEMNNNIMSSLNKVLGNKLDNYQDKTNAIEEKINNKFYSNDNTDLVKITFSGNNSIISINISEDLLDETDPDLLQDLIISSIKNIQAQIKKDSDIDMQKAFSGFTPNNFLKK